MTIVVLHCSPPFFSHTLILLMQLALVKSLPQLVNEGILSAYQRWCLQNYTSTSKVSIAMLPLLLSNTIPFLLFCRIFVLWNVFGRLVSYQNLCLSVCIISWPWAYLAIAYYDRAKLLVSLDSRSDIILNSFLPKHIIYFSLEINLPFITIREVPGRLKHQISTRHPIVTLVNTRYRALNYFLCYNTTPYYYSTWSTRLLAFIKYYYY